MHRLLAGVPFALALLAAACGDPATGSGGDGSGDNGGGTPPPGATVDAVRFTQRSDTLSPAEAAQFAAEAVTAAGAALAGKTITWTTSDPAVATVSAAGRVTAVAPGSATITASADGKQASTTLAVVRSWSWVGIGTRFPDPRCGLSIDRRAWCWGPNDAGQFGIGTASGIGWEPLTPAAGGLRWSSLSMGYRYVCGIAEVGTAYCWGQLQKNESAGGVLVTPQQVPNAPAFDTIAAGQWHGCGITPARAAWCWGRNIYGSNGNGATDPSGSMSAANAPAVAVVGGHTWASVQPGGRDYTCGLTTSGTAYCWGTGSLGNGTTYLDSVPHPVAGGHVFTALATGFNGACALTRDGTAWCWGPDVTPDAATTPVSLATGLRFTTLAAGFRHMCSLTAEGLAYCWGNNARGELGAPSQDCNGQCSFTPVAVQGNHVFVQISAGEGASCGITAGGALWCWGYPGPADDGLRQHFEPVRVGHPAGTPTS